MEKPRGIVTEALGAMVVDWLAETSYPVESFVLRRGKTESGERRLI